MQVMWGVFIFHQCWLLPLTLIIGIGMLFAYVQWAAFSSLTVFLVLLLPNYFFVKKFMSKIGEIFALRDARVRYLTEQLQGIQLIKQLGWERLKFVEVLKRRIKEVNNRWWLRLWLLFVILLAFATPLLINIFTFGVILIQSSAPLTAATGYTVLSLTGIVQAPISGLGRVISSLSSVLTAVTRISKFLCAEETKETLLLTNEVAVGAGHDDKKGYYYCPNGDTPDGNETRTIAIRMDGLAVRWGNVTEKDAALLKASEKNSHRRFRKKNKTKETKTEKEKGRMKGKGFRYAYKDINSRSTNFIKLSMPGLRKLT